ncbi:sugar phosphate isomerase/epimerase family protein [Paenibacillus lignilyticus]|uniref:Sugar phosphate isomerase/epimerase n=1 Tax=Paenibacillus lignilyticus TaxID=1172615 RepID=A0ABS5C9K9_9BACL|nr:sugar phosphate isomerase/epimerase family protein [Paenibacillus lignilyticus]MBP3962676.1 sugar phosphate isomerase/epimerase [Paenibacillus lignilyticus]
MAFRAGELGFGYVVLDTFPGLKLQDGRLVEADCKRILKAFSFEKVQIAAVGGYRNLIHPDPQIRVCLQNELIGLIQLCEAIGAPMLCSETGSYHPDGWTWDPANMTEQAFQQLIDSLEPLVREGQKRGVCLGLEPYVMNVAYNTERLARVIKHFGQQRIKAVFDPAGLLTRMTSQVQKDALPEMLASIVDSIGLIHVEDFIPASSLNDHFEWIGAGQGLLDYVVFMNAVIQSGYEGPMIFEHLTQSDIPAAVQFVRTKWELAQRQAMGEKK